MSEERLEDVIKERDALRAIVDPLNRLRNEKGAWVNFVYDSKAHSDQPLLCQVNITASWTNWGQKSFGGNTLQEALAAAEAAKAAEELRIAEEAKAEREARLAARAERKRLEGNT